MMGVLAHKLALVLGVLGCLVFGGLFVTSCLDPGMVEHLAREAIRMQVEKKVGARIEAMDSSYLARQAERYIKDYEEKARIARQQILDKLPERVAAVLTEMYQLDCECRKKIEKRLLDGLHMDIRDSAQVQEKLNALIRTQYMETANKLTREFRIFTGTNAAVFALLLLAARIRQDASLLLLPAVAVLLLAAGLTGALYLHQDWLHTIVFSDYVGFAYLGWLGLACILLGDLILNRARITTSILSSIGGSVSPC